MIRAQDPPKSILFIIVTRIGDTLFTTPAMRAVAEKYPNATITVLAHPNRFTVLQNLPFINKVEVIEKYRSYFMGYFGNTQYDIAIVYGHDKPLISYALRVASRVVAFRQNNKTLNSRMHISVKEPEPHSEHLVKKSLRLTEALNISTDNLRIAYRVTEEEKTIAASILHNSKLDQTSPLIGIQATSFPTKAWRNWPTENFVNLGKDIQDNWPTAGFAVFGGPDDKKTTSSIKEKLGNQAIDLAGQPLRINGAIMSLLDAYIGIDTGPTHIMGSFDIPFVGLYHCLGPHTIVGPLGHPIDFSINHPKTGDICDESTPMSEIPVASILKQLQMALDYKAT